MRSCYREVLQYLKNTTRRSCNTYNTCNTWKILPVGHAVPDRYYRMPGLAISERYYREVLQYLKDTISRSCNTWPILPDGLAISERYYWKVLQYLKDTAWWRSYNTWNERYYRKVLQYLKDTTRWSCNTGKILPEGLAIPESSPFKRSFIDSIQNEHGRGGLYVNRNATYLNETWATMLDNVRNLQDKTKRWFSAYWASLHNQTWSERSGEILKSKGTSVSKDELTTK